MDGAGDEFFAGAALAGDHDGGVAVGDAADHFENLLHGGGLSDDAVLVLLDGERGFEGFGAAGFGGGFQGGVDDDLEVEGKLFLADEVEGAEAHGFDDTLGGAEGAGDDDEGVGVAFAQAGEEFESAMGSEAGFGDDDKGVFGAEKFEGFLGGLGGDNADIVGAEMLLRPIEEIGIGVGDENGFFGGHASGNQMPPKRRWRPAYSCTAARRSSLLNSGQGFCVTTISV